MTMKANKYKIKLDPIQQEKLAVQLGHARFIYNYALQSMLPAMKRERLYSWKI
jgi:hypothetical protein